MIDVLIPTASASQFVETAVASAAAQNVDVSIYIIENATHDRVYQRHLHALADKYHATYVAFDERLPAAANWQRCLSIGKNEWIGFLHDDDVWNTQYLTRCCNVIESADIIAYNYAYFSGSVSDNESDSVCEYKDLKTREELAAKLIANRYHFSSLLFRRSVGMKFSPNLRYYMDQNALMECALGDNKRRLSVLLGAPNWIRVHPKQGTWGIGVVEAAAREDAYNYTEFCRKVATNGLNLQILADEILKNVDEAALVRFVSMTCGRRPLRSNLRLTFNILTGKRSVRFTAKAIVRLLLQNIVWEIKSALHSLNNQLRKKV